MEFSRIFDANLRLIWAKCYLCSHWLHCFRTKCDSFLHTIDWFSEIIIFHDPPSSLILLKISKVNYGYNCKTLTFNFCTQFFFSFMIFVFCFAQSEKHSFWMRIVSLKFLKISCCIWKNLKSGLGTSMGFEHRPIYKKTWNCDSQQSKLTHQFHVIFLVWPQTYWLVCMSRLHHKQL